MKASPPIRWGRTRGLLWGLMAACFLTACGGPTPAPSPLPSTPLPASPTATVTPTPTVPQPAEVGASVEQPSNASPVEVPEASLSTGAGRTQTAVTGAYCWTGGDGRTVCADPFALLVPTDPLSVAPSEPLVFTLGAGTPTFVTMRVLDWQPDDAPAAPSPTGTVAIRLDSQEVATGDLEPSPYHSLGRPANPRRLCPRYEQRLPWWHDRLWLAHSRGAALRVR